MRIGVFGGTFDPPHIGHLILASEACTQRNTDRFLWVLTPDPPHKQGRNISPLADRLAMLEAALQGNAKFEISRVDIDRPPPHYAFDTIRLLQAEFPLAEIIYVIGGDSLRDLPTWRRPQELVELVSEIAVFERPGIGVDIDAVEDKIPGIARKLRRVGAPLLEVSSTDIRRRAAKGYPFRYFLLPEVYEIIVARSLYRLASPVRE
jgi:nicotinate-nucleotide adenylyltransferase